MSAHHRCARSVCGRAADPPATAPPMARWSPSAMSTMPATASIRRRCSPTGRPARSRPCPDGRTLRTFEIIAEDKEIEIAPGIMFPAWTYNGRVPGPTLRATEGDRLRIVFRNSGSHPHSMHFHGIHAARMDGVPGAGMVDPGEEFVYEFDARPFGCHLYHCHALPLKRHLHKGMYGAFIIDPDPARHPEHADVARSRLLGTPRTPSWQEMVMVMNAFDTNFDGGNEVYAANTVAHCYMKAPIRIVREPAGPHLSRQRHRVRPDQLLPPARQFLRLFRPGHDADADAEDRRPDRPVPGAARHPRIHLQGPRARPLHVPPAPVRVHRARLGRHVRRRGGRGMRDARFGGGRRRRFGAERAALSSGLSCRSPCSPSPCGGSSRPIR